LRREAFGEKLCGMNGIFGSWPEAFCIGAFFCSEPAVANIVCGGQSLFIGWS
jgi:hypothetical protein